VKAYEPREYWTQVADEIGQRPDSNLFAGLDTPFYRYKRSKFLEKFLRTIPAEGKSILEIGCGPGGNLLELAKAAPQRLVGCDISPAMIDLATRNTHDKATVELVVTDGKTLPFADREFEITFTSTVLQHNLDDGDLSALLGEICRVTGDTIYLFEDTSRTRRVRYSAVLRPVEDYVRFCAQNGFELVEAEMLGVYASERAAGGLRRVLNRPPLKPGEPISRVNDVAERVALPPTRLLDAVIPQPRGLTKMVLRRAR
jgi:SAM-dependent methyltransferase